MKSNDYIAELWVELESIARQERGSMSLKRRYEGLYRVLVGALNFCTQELTMEFSGPFARLDHLCRQIHYKELHPKGYAAVLALRGRCTHLRHYGEEELLQWAANDLKALCDFLAALFTAPVPSSLALLLPSDYAEVLQSGNGQKWDRPSLRVAVDSCDVNGIHVTDEEGESWLVPWLYTVFERPVDLTYMQRWLQPSTQLNLVRPSRVDEKMLIAEHVIYEPDYLIETSAIGGCFKVYGHSPYEMLMRRLAPFSITSAILLGNFVGQMLEEEIRDWLLINDNWLLVNDEEFRVKGEGLRVRDGIPYAEARERFLKQNALAVLTCQDLQTAEQWAKFDAEAQQQQMNLRKMVRKTFAEDKTIDLQKAVLEPSFYCEMLGVQGRFDLMQLDKHVLMEQKSGKRDEYAKSHKEEHYVQMLVYQAMLHYAYRDGNGKSMRNDDIASYLLYSKYDDGLLKESPAPLLLAEALKLRNQLAFLDLYLSRNRQGRSMIEQLRPEHLNTKQSRGKIWDVFSRPRIASVLDRLQGARDIEKDYFYRMLRFVAREQVLGKMGNSRKEASGFAALWNCTTAEKKEAGNLMDGLCIIGLSDEMDEVTLMLHNDETETLPNFREDDIVVLYAYHRDEEPDARRDLLLRGKVKQMRPDRVVVSLNAPQHNKGVYHLDDDNLLWALEHDYMESSTTGQYHGLFDFMCAPQSRRDLLLGQRRPERDESQRLRGSYGRFDELVLKARQARDFFLLIGPPGTGKTSCGMVNILKEHLADEGTSVLMVSYTNRAVEEMCSKLEQKKIGYLHIGHHNGEMTAAELAESLRNARVVVGTTTSLTNNNALFALRSFDLCIIDEASQILEPHLLPILSATGRDGKEAVRKFVMIGDHKQLPAVVQQGEEESRVEEASLREIGLENCRQSLFERLLRHLEPCFFHMLSAQGRMHHEVADFANRHFYASLLTEVPLEHQQRAIPYTTAHKEDRLLRLLTERRVTFLPVEKRPNVNSSDKTNPEEAQLIAEIVEAVFRLYAENGIPFDAQQSVGVIVPYRHQISTVRRCLQTFGIDELMDIAIDTVERFQGSQRDVIIYGFTVSKPYQLDFLTNNVFADSDGQMIDRKLNVALTRARESLFIVGNPKLLKQNGIFSELLDYKI